MNKNVNNSCICELGYNKGAFRKTIENNIFTVFGNISKNNSIVLRYHGELIDSICYEKYENNLYIKYYFDDDKNNIFKENLAKCAKCIGENYCILIDLCNNSKITFSFCLEEDLEKDDLMSFNLNIQNDLLSSFIDKYDCDCANISSNSNLPVLKTKSDLKIKKIIQILKNYFMMIKNRITSA